MKRCYKRKRMLAALQKKMIAATASLLMMQVLQRQITVMIN